MIWPWSFHWKGWNSVSITLSLVVLNLFVFVLVDDLSKSDVEILMPSAEQLRLTAELYYQYQGKFERPDNEVIPQLVSQAIQDPTFIRLAPLLQFRGDPIHIEDWKGAWTKYHQQLEKRAMKGLGFSHDKNGFFNAITYQFVHAGFFHLLSNLTLLFLFGAAVETLFGGLTLILVYLLGGIVGGVFYLFAVTPTMVPMVGASVSVSALLGFYLIAEERRNVRFMYFFSPLQGYFGEIYLSKWWLISVFMLSDLTMLFRDSIDTNFIAYWGHLGGLLFGLLLGICFHLSRYVLRGLRVGPQ